MLLENLVLRYLDQTHILSYRYGQMLAVLESQPSEREAGGS